jgi:hypothetical protein
MNGVSSTPSEAFIVSFAGGFGQYRQKALSQLKKTNEMKQMQSTFKKKFNTSVSIRDSGEWGFLLHLIGGGFYNPQPPARASRSELQ